LAGTQTYLQKDISLRGNREECQKFMVDGVLLQLFETKEGEEGNTSFNGGTNLLQEKNTLFHESCSELMMRGLDD